MADELIAAVNALLESDLGTVDLLSAFRDSDGEIILATEPGDDPTLASENRTEPLDVDRMIDIVDVALTLLSRCYVHLAGKRLLHATDPQQALRNLRSELEEIQGRARRDAQPGGVPPAVFHEELIGERAFHDRMTAIFASLRDRHTRYELPFPYRRIVAFLPFLVEAAVASPAAGYNGEPPVYLATRVVGDVFGDTTEPIVLTHWNGVPIRMAVARIAERTGGANPSARHQRAVDRLTQRWLGVSTGPEEDEVRVGYRIGDAQQLVTVPWLAVRAPARLTNDGLPADDERAPYVMGRDAEGAWLDRVSKRLYYKPTLAQTEEPKWKYRPENLDGAIAYREHVHRSRPGGTYGYLRVYSFTGADDAKYVAAVRDLLSEEHAVDGLIIDVRGNPGGSIPSAEGLLPLFAPGPVEFEGLQFLNTPEAMGLAQGEYEWRGGGGSIDIHLEEARATAAPYVASQPVTDVGPTQQVYQGPVVVIIDALTYSASELFAAGMQDHGLADIIGTARQTGGGGANVWTLEFIVAILKRINQERLLAPPPAYGTSFEIAMRRTTRVRRRAGVALEDMGVLVPRESVRPLTQADVLGANEDLLDFAVETLGAMQNHRIHAAFDGVNAFKLSSSKANTAEGIDRVDVYCDGRPVTSVRAAPPAADAVSDPFPTPVELPREWLQRAPVLFRAFAGGADPVTTYTWSQQR